MSLRPSFAAFELRKLNTVFGCKDFSVVKILTERYGELAVSNKEVQQAQEVFKMIISGEILQNPPAVENELFQNVMLCLAEYSQDLNFSESIFWEAFLSDIEHAQGAYDDGPTELLRYLLVGRPLIGKSIKSTWSYYAYFTHEEARLIFKFIRSQNNFLEEFDFEDAEEWMKTIERDRNDIWFYAS